MGLGTEHDAQKGWKRFEIYLIRTKRNRLFNKDLEIMTFDPKVRRPQSHAAYLSHPSFLTLTPLSARAQPTKRGL